MADGLQTLLKDGTSVENIALKGKADTHAIIINSNYPWDDFDFSVNNLRINPATTKPDYDYNEGEFLFDAGTTETVVGAKITKHNFAQGQPEWRPHIHWVQSSAGNVVWQLQYKIWPANATEPTYTTISAYVPEMVYTSGTVHQITELPAVDVSSYSDSTAMMVKVKVSRLGGDANDTYAVDARFLGFDFHVQIDSLGSRQEFIK
jgi:hypothetical protein